MTNQRTAVIPPFDHNNVTPPHLGSPTLPSDVSPYPCTTLELCQRFSTSKARIEILKGLLSFREKMSDLGVLTGFQWLDGSFTENIEVSEGRAPNDLDIVTFYRGDITGRTVIENVLVQFPEFFDSDLSKINYKLDHYIINYSYNPEYTVEATRYWVQLFSHNRLSIWKGILRIELNTPTDDRDALTFLSNLTV